MEYLAHSANANSPSQTYLNHVKGVCRRAVTYAAEAERHSYTCNGRLKDIVQRSALWHDLGKLDSDNQAALHKVADKKQSLPWNHVDAGSAALLACGGSLSAFVVYSHHTGLPDKVAEKIRGNKKYRDEKCEVRSRFDAELDELINRHTEILSTEYHTVEESYEGNQTTFYRMALSCLADADHTDTAAAYGQISEGKSLPQLRANERLEALNRYVSGLGKEDERSRLRSEMYVACRDAKVTGAFTACDSPVGSGKTTAVMAHLLEQAIERKARRVFVVLPFTNIINQSVEVYRRSLVLPGENPNEVVAELHSRADFQDTDTHYLTSLWRSPIIVTTAVAFFETLASNRPSSLRRLHELPGSVVFIDEAHSALPLKLLPLAWRWMNTLADEWNCYWVLASGSLVRYWQLNSLKSDKIDMPLPIVDELISEKLHEQLIQYESHRVNFQWKSGAVNRKELVEWVQSMPGPRLIILNTMQSAAVIADDFCRTYGRKSVEHLSTALTAEDRGNTIRSVKARLEDKSDTDWTLVATSCVEAGVDFSFRSGFRELSSLLSLLQAAGRINRNGLYSDAIIWSFSLQDDSMLKKNPALDKSREVLKNYLSRGVEITPELSTKSLNDEIILDDSCIRTIKHLNDMENDMQFKTVCDEFVVIESNTVPAVVVNNPEGNKLAESIAHGCGDWQLLQIKSVFIRHEKISEWDLEQIVNGVFKWELSYDSFLGYMRGVLDIEKSKKEPLII